MLDIGGADRTRTGDLLRDTQRQLIYLVGSSTFVNAVGDFTASHVKVLQFLWKGNTALRPPITNYGQAIEQAHPELRGQGDLVQHIMNHLRNRGFSPLSGPSAAHPQHQAITNLGIEFLTFLSAPETQEPGAP